MISFYVLLIYYTVLWTTLNTDCDKEEQSIISDKEEELSNKKNKSNKQNEIKQEVLKTDNEELLADEKVITYS